jgi:hypothetical protein
MPFSIQVNVFARPAVAAVPGRKLPDGGIPALRVVWKRDQKITKTDGLRLILVDFPRIFSFYAPPRFFFSVWAGDITGTGLPRAVKDPMSERVQVRAR